jgi:phage gp36-like protein
MGDYIDVKDLNMTEALLIKLTDVTNSPPTTTDIKKVNKCILKAEGIVKGFIGTQFELELAAAEISELVKDLTSDVAEYKIWMSSKKETPDKVRLAYDDAMSMLKDIAAGRMSLGLDTTNEAAAKGNKLTAVINRGGA